MRKPVFGVSDQAPHKPGCTATEDGYRLEISYIGSRWIVLSVSVAKTKALISSASLFSHMFSYDPAHIISILQAGVLLGPDSREK